MTYKLYDYQQDLVTRAQKSYRSGHKAPCIVLPCGGGKSIIIAEIIRQSALKGNDILFLVHRKELKEQITATLIGNDVDMQRVHVGMVQTVVLNLEKHPRYNLIVIDENHHALANSYRKIIDYFDTYLIGFTATPIRLNGDGLGDVNDILIEGPDVEWLIDNERLAPYDYYSVDLTDKDKLKKSSTGDYTGKSMDDSLGDTIYGDIIKHYRDIIDGQKTILYAHSVKYSKMYADAFNDAGIPARHIDAKTPKQEREEIIERFRQGEILVLSNVDILGEGFDVPDCTATMLLRPTESLSLHIQQSMRPMRYRPGKRATIIDHVGNVYRHGFPDTERTWTLDKKERKKREEVEPYPVWTCEIEAGGCGMVFPSDDIEKLTRYDKESETETQYCICPACGIEHIVAQSTDKKFEDEELKKLEKEDTSKEYYRRRNWKDAKTYRELLKIADARGYKPSWAAFKAKELGLIDTPHWVYTWKPKSPLSDIANLF